MDKHGLFIAAMLDSASKAYAAGVASRVLDARPDDETIAFSELSEEAELRLRLLAEAAAAGRPALFAYEMRWMRHLYDSRGKDWRLLDLELQSIESELAERLPPTGPEGFVSSFIAAARDELGVERPLPAPMDFSAATHGKLAESYLEAILEGRTDDAIAEVTQAADGGVPIEELHDCVIVPVQREIGRRWHLGDLHISEEHLGTRTTAELIGLLRTRIPRPEPGARKVLAAGPSGSHHDIGLQMAADRLRLAGWAPIVLGADTPPDDFARAATRHDASLVAVSMPMTLNFRQTYAAINTVKSMCDTPIVVGGAPLGVVEDLWEILGADAGAPHASDVVAAADRAINGG